MWADRMGLCIGVSLLTRVFLCISADVSRQMGLCLLKLVFLCISADLGGQMGLCIGASLLTLVELIQLGVGIFIRASKTKIK